jgi:adenine phosphoribosyltransferase
MDRLQASLRDAPIVEKDGYHYFVHPVSDGVPTLDPSLLREITVKIVRKAQLADVDKIVTPAAMGIHISTALSLATDVPLVVIRKREYGLEGETPLHQETGYGESQMFVNDVHPGERVVVIDDVLSTGGTLSAVLGALDEIGAEVVDTVAVIKKVGGVTELDEDQEVKTLVNVDVVDGEVVIVDEHGDG